MGAIGESFQSFDSNSVTSIVQSPPESLGLDINGLTSSESGFGKCLRSDLMR